MKSSILKLISLLFSTLFLMINAHAEICCSYYGPGGGTSGQGEVCHDNYQKKRSDCIQDAENHDLGNHDRKLLRIRYGEGKCQKIAGELQCVNDNDDPLEPLAVKLIFFLALQVEDGIQLTWETHEKLVAVNVWRAQKNAEGAYFDIVKLNAQVVYNNTFTDKTAQAGIKYFYGLETIDHAGVADLDIGSVISAIR